jgi:hypothetical protein
MLAPSLCSAISRRTSESDSRSPSFHAAARTPVLEEPLHGRLADAVPLGGHAVLGSLRKAVTHSSISPPVNRSSADPARYGVARSPLVVEMSRVGLESALGGGDLHVSSFGSIDGCRVTGRATGIWPRGHGVAPTLWVCPVLLSASACCHCRVAAHCSH